ncbi:MAG: PHP domain-containing protein [Negativicutes bacterium]|jgi:predicted metal-dependent phosphoesterase TrpH
MMRVDLHIHTTASDGNWRPEVLVNQVKSAGIGLFAVTDHDTTANINETSALAAAAGLNFLPGVEICTTINNQSFHILGYGIDADNAALNKLLRYNTALMEDVDQQSVKKLIKDGLAIDYDEYCQYRHNPERGGWKALNFLIDKGFCRDINDFFANLFTKERGITFPDFPPPSVAIAAIKGAGGVPVLAHPGSGFHGSTLEETLDFFVREDIQGVECYHPCHDENTTKRAVEWCKQRNLIITGGSDCHGSFFKDRCLGRPEIYLEQLNLGILELRLPPMP